MNVRDRIGLPWWGEISLLLCVLMLGVLEMVTFSHDLDTHPLGYHIQKGKKTVLITHGGLANKETMLAYAYAFADSGKSVILADLPAHGGSPYAVGKELQHSFDKWEKEAKKENVVTAVGHSLGSTILCKNKKWHPQFSQTIHIGKFESCKSGRNLHGTDFQVPSKDDYHIDHLLEPWNPNVITKIKSIKKTLDKPKRYKLWVYGVGPWLIFGFGLVTSIGVQHRIHQKWTEKPLVVGVGSALMFVFVFSVLSWKRLWYPFLVHRSDVLVFVLMSVVPISFSWVLQRWFEKWKYVLVTLPCSTLWIWGVAYGFSNYWSTLTPNWPYGGVIELYPVLIAVGVTPLVVLVLQCFRFSSSFSKSICFILLMSYAGALLLPHVPM